MLLSHLSLLECPLSNRVPTIKQPRSQPCKSDLAFSPALQMLLGHLMFVAQLVAKQEKLDPGFRVVINDGPQGKHMQEKEDAFSKHVCLFQHTSA